MKLAVVLASVMLSGICAPNADADEPAAPNAPPPIIDAPAAPNAPPPVAEAPPAAPAPLATPAPKWILGAGLGFDFGPEVTFTSSEASAVSDRDGRIPQLHLLAERRIGERTWLGLGLFGRVAWASEDGPPGLPASSSSTARTLGARVGLRQVFASLGRVDLSGVLSVGAAELAEHSEAERGGPGVGFTDTSITSLFAAAGVTLDCHITADLAARVGVDLVRGAYSTFTVNSPIESTGNFGGPQQTFGGEHDGTGYVVEAAPSGLVAVEAEF